MNLKTHLLTLHIERATKQQMEAGEKSAPKLALPFQNLLANQDQLHPGVNHTPIRFLCIKQLSDLTGEYNHMSVHLIWATSL